MTDQPTDNQNHPHRAPAVFDDAGLCLVCANTILRKDLRVLQASYDRLREKAEAVVSTKYWHQRHQDFGQQIRKSVDELAAELERGAQVEP